jgi:hypothetical protein
MSDLPFGCEHIFTRYVMCIDCRGKVVKWVGCGCNQIEHLCQPFPIARGQK